MRKLFILIFLFSGLRGFGYSSGEEMVYALMHQDSRVEVFYFHLTRRCATCKAVENVTRNYVEKRYDDRVKFTALNLDEKEGRIVAEKHGVNGQALIIVSGDSTTDITGKAFMNALKSPEKLEELIAEIIDPLMVPVK